jgi:anti-anti-sigma factor
VRGPSAEGTPQPPSDLAGLGVSPVRDVERGHEWTLLVLAGELDLHTSPALGEAIVRERERGAGRLVLDLRAVTFLDSTALRVLLVARSQLREAGGEVVLLAPGAEVRRTLDVSGVSRLLTIHDEAPRGG